MRPLQESGYGYESAPVPAPGLRLHFYDTDLAARLAGVNSPGTLRLSPMRGPIFPGWVVSEVMKHRLNHLRDAISRS